MNTKLHACEFAFAAFFALAVPVLAQDRIGGMVQVRGRRHEYVEVKPVRAPISIRIKTVSEKPLGSYGVETATARRNEPDDWE